MLVTPCQRKRLDDEFKRFIKDVEPYVSAQPKNEQIAFLLYVSRVEKSLREVETVEGLLGTWNNMVDGLNRFLSWLNGQDDQEVEQSMKITKENVNAAREFLKKSYVPQIYERMKKINMLYVLNGENNEVPTPC